MSNLVSVNEYPKVPYLLSPNNESITPFNYNQYDFPQSWSEDQRIMSNKFYNFHIHNRSDFEEESPDSGKPRKRKSSLSTIKSVSKKSILEDILELLDEGRFGIKWTTKIDTEGDEQDGILVYDEGLLERTLQERRNVKNYGLSKHLSKDLRYYGFMYDKEYKIFWNEDNKNPITKKSPWQKDDRSTYILLKRIASESERNLSRLLSLVHNVELAEVLKNPEIAAKVCPPPNKYINLHKIYIIIENIDLEDVNNIMILLSKDFNNHIVKKNISNGLVPIADIDRLINRMGGSLSNFLENFREFIKGAKEWYHGFIESEEASECLRNREEGTFLIRESTRSDCYSLSWVANNDGVNPPIIKHMRILQTSSGYKVSTDSEPSRTLPLWIKDHSEYLKYPLPNPKYNNLYVHGQSTIKTENCHIKNLPKGYVLGFPF